MKIKKDDTVRVVAGKYKGKVAKVTKVHAGGKVALEKLNIVQRHIKPSQLQPQGGTKEVHIPIDVSNVALVIDDKEKTSRIGYSFNKDGKKIRIARQSGNKEIK